MQVTSSKKILFFIFCLCITFSKTNAFAPPDWDTAYDAIIAKDLVTLQNFIDEIVVGPWQCQKKFTYLSCLMGRINSFNEVAARNTTSELLPVPEDLAQRQRIIKQVNRNIKYQRQIVNKTGEMLKNIINKQENLKRQLSVPHPPQLVDQLIFSANSLVEEGLNNIYLSQDHYTLNDIFLHKQAKQKRDGLMMQSQEKINIISKKNQEIDILLEQLISQKQKNLAVISEQRAAILKIQENYLKQKNLPEKRNEEILQFMYNIEKDLNQTIQEANDKIRQIRKVQVSIIKEIGPLNGLSDLLIKIQKAHHECYFIKADEIVYENNTVTEKMNLNFLKLFLYKSLGPGSFQTIDQFLPQPIVQMKIINFFDKSWIGEYGQTLDQSIIDPQCCIVDVFNFRSGRIIKIQGNQMTIKFFTGRQMVLTMNVCSRVYQMTPKFNRILFISEPFASINKVYTALIYGDEGVPKSASLEQFHEGKHSILEQRQNLKNQQIKVSPEQMTKNVETISQLSSQEQNNNNSSREELLSQKLNQTEQQVEQNQGKKDKIGQGQPQTEQFPQQQVDPKQESQQNQTLLLSQQKQLQREQLQQPLQMGQGQTESLQSSQPMEKSILMSQP